MPSLYTLTRSDGIALGPRMPEASFEHTAPGSIVPNMPFKTLTSREVMIR